MSSPGPGGIAGLGLEALIRHMPAAVMVVEAGSGRIVHYNALALEMTERQLGRPMPSELTRDWVIFHPDGRPYRMDEWPLVRSMTSGENVAGEEYFNVLPDGSRLVVRCSSSPIVDDEGRIVAGVLVMDDVTERKRAEERLGYLAGLLDNTEDGVLAMDERYVVTVWNKGAERLYGWRADEVVGRPVDEVVRTNLSGEQRDDLRRELVEHGRWRGEVSVARKDRTTVEVEIVSVALRGEQREITGYLTIHRDVTERRQADQRVRDARQAERRRLARDLHDEALQALTDGVAQTILARTGAGDAATAERLAGVIATLQSVSQHVRAAIYDLRFVGEEDRPIGEQLAELVERQSAVAVDSQIGLEIRAGAPTGPLGPPATELLRVVREAIINARRHSGARTIRVVLSGSRTTLSVAVTDDGRGIDAAAPSASSGTGIAGMRERAALLGAELEVRSEPAAGSSVILKLPLWKYHKTAVDVRVLLVDDHAAVRQAIAAMFERDPGFVVVGQATTLAEARRSLADVDVAVVDLGLPDGFGGDLIGELRDLNPAAQSVILTASLDPADTARAERAGAAAILNKTVDLDQLLDTVRRLATPTRSPPSSAGPR